MAVEVRFRPGARTDLFDLYTYIAAQSGRERAGSYIERIYGGRDLETALRDS